MLTVVVSWVISPQAGQWVSIPELDFVTGAFPSREGICLQRTREEAGAAGWCRELLAAHCSAAENGQAVEWGKGQEMEHSEFPTAHISLPCSCSPARARFRLLNSTSDGPWEQRLTIGWSTLVDAAWPLGQDLLKV